jgi:hypothetical protein
MKKGKGLSAGAAAAGKAEVEVFRAEVGEGAVAAGAVVEAGAPKETGADC